MSAELAGLRPPSKREQATSPGEWRDVGTSAASDPLSARRFRQGTLALVGLALGLGLLRLSHNDIWYDEAASLFFARQSGLGFFRVLLREDTHGPVYYGLLRLWTLALGESMWTVRLPSVVCAAGAVLITAHLGARLFGRTLGLLGALLLAASPFHLYYAQEVRFHSFLELLASLHLLSFLHLSAPPSGADGRPARWPWWTFVITGAACVLTFYLSGLLLVAEALVAGFAWRTIPRRRVFTAFAVLAIVCSLWLPALVWQVRHTHGTVRWIPDRSTWKFLAETGQTFTAGKHAIWLDHVVTVALAVAVAVALVQAFRRRQREQIALACWFSLPVLAILVISNWQPLYEPRYLFAILPAFFLLAVAGVGRLRNPWLRLPVFAVLVAMFASADVRQYAHFKFSERWRDAAAYVRKQAMPTDVLVTLPSHEVVSLYYYFPEFKRRRGTNRAFDVNHMFVRGSRLWLFTYQDGFRVPQESLTPDALLLESRDFGTLNVSSFLLRR